MKRNGFTLVELLAVIAIMAILVIITLPNIMELYIDAGKRAYIVDVESMIKESERKYISESINSNKITIVSSDSENKLDSSSSNKYDYSFFLDQKGNVNHVIISNGTYCIDSDYVAGIDLYEKLHECDLDFIEVVEGFQKSYVLFGGYYWKVLANVGDFNDFMEELKARNNIHDDSTYDFEETDSDYLLLLYDDNVLPNEPLLKLINGKYENSEVDTYLNTTFYDSLGKNKKYLKNVGMATTFSNGCQSSCSSYKNKVGLLGTNKLIKDYGFLSNLTFDNASEYDFSRMWIPVNGNGAVHNYMLSSINSKDDECENVVDEETGIENEVCNTLYKYLYSDKVGYIEYTNDEITTNIAHLRPIIAIDRTKIQGVKLLEEKGFSEEEQYTIIEREVQEMLENLVHQNMSDEQIDALGGMDNAKLQLLEQMNISVSDIESLARSTIRSGVFGNKPVYQLVME